MHNYLGLTKILFKTSFSSFRLSKRGKVINGLLFGLIAICVLPLIYSIYFLFDGMFEGYGMIDQSGFVLSAGFYLSCVITFVFSIFLTPAIFYFSKDIETLLYLPLKPVQIIASKFTVLLLYEYTATLLISLPMMIAYGLNFQPDAFVYIFMLIGILLLPILPLVFSSTLIVLVLKFFPRFKNRDMFNLVGSFFAIALSLVISYFSQQLALASPKELQSLMMQGNNSMIDIMGYLFVNTRFLVSAIIDLNILDLLIYIVITLGSVALFLWVAQRFYFSGAIGVNETTSRRKELSKEVLDKKTSQQSILITYIKKELRLLIRTPIYFLNCIAINFLLPILMFATSFSDSDLLSQTTQISSMFTFDSLQSYSVLMLVALAGGILYGNLNAISVTAISREGANYIFMKYILVNLMTQINAKVFSGIIVSIVSFTLLFIGTIYLLSFPILPAICAYLVGLLGIVVSNYIGILIDLLHPKLVWEQETAVVKQNVNVIVVLLVSMGLAAGLVFLTFTLDGTILTYLMLALTIGLLILLPILYRAVKSVSTRLFYKL